MKNNIKLIITTIVILIIVSTICNLTYDWTGLDDLFGVKINIIQWCGLALITNLLFPAKNLLNKENKKNDTEGPKVPRDISSHGF